MRSRHVHWKVSQIHELNLYIVHCSDFWTRMGPHPNHESPLGQHPKWRLVSSKELAKHQLREELLQLIKEGTPDVEDPWRREEIMKKKGQEERVWERSYHERRLGLYILTLQRQCRQILYMCKWALCGFHGALDIWIPAVLVTSAREPA